MEGSITFLLTNKNRSNEGFPVGVSIAMIATARSLKPMVQVKVEDLEHASLLGALGLTWTPPKADQLTCIGGVKQVAYKNSRKYRFTTGLSLALKGLSLHYAYEYSPEIDVSHNNHFMSVSLKL